MLDVAVEVVQQFVAETTGAAADSVTRQQALEMLDAKALHTNPVLLSVLKDVFVQAPVSG